MRRSDASIADAATPSRVRDASATRDATPPGSDDCSGAAKLVYVIDGDGMLSSFRPDTLEFHDIGQVNCESSGPNSMSVDRQGTAWVAYLSGNMYRVSTTDASCAPIARPAGAGGFDTFGMGFVSVDGDTNNDELFIASVSASIFGVASTSQLGVIDPMSLTTTTVGDLAGSGPELTGTADGKLWAFYAQDVERTLARIDISSGATLESHVLNTISNFGASAWAMAFWGGDFFIFLKGALDTSTTVYRVDGKTFEQSVAIQSTGRTIVGAGVSTCAPLDFFL